MVPVYKFVQLLVLLSVVAQQAGDLTALQQGNRRPGELQDAMIAGLVLACHATPATKYAAL